MVFIIIAALASSLVIIVIAIQRQSLSSKQDPARRLERLVTLETSSQVAHYLAQGDRLNAVKAYRAETGSDLKEATSYIDKLIQQADQAE
jgi:ribosomal protein L7/L12